MVKESLKSLLFSIRKMRLRRTRKNLKNCDFSIISNNCIAGCIYHDLGKKFLTPTINLWMSESNFIVFANNFSVYLNAPVFELKDDKYNYPCGEIVPGRGYKNIELFFKHYSSFEEAKNKWIERASRVNLEKIRIVMVSIEGKKDIVEGFKTIKYKKIMITGNRKITNGNDILFAKSLLTKDNPHVYVNMFGKKGYDLFDFNDFLGD